MNVPARIKLASLTDAEISDDDLHEFAMRMSCSHCGKNSYTILTPLIPGVLAGEGPTVFRRCPVCYTVISKPNPHHARHDA